MIRKFFGLFFAMGLLLIAQSRAQVGFTNGGFELNLPDGWAEYEPPKALVDLITKHGDLLFYAESDDGKFIVSRFKIPPMADKSGFVAGYLDGFRKSAAQSGVKLDEDLGTFKDKFPRFSYAHSVQENGFLHTSSIFTEKLLYNVQIMGPQAMRAELVKTLDGVIVRDPPMAVATFQKGTTPGARQRAEMHELGRRVGYIVGICFFFAVMAGVVLLILKLTGAIGRSSKRPPPLPPSARSTPPPPPR